MVCAVARVFTGNNSVDMFAICTTTQVIKAQSELGNPPVYFLLHNPNTPAAEWQAVATNLTVLQQEWSSRKWSCAFCTSVPLNLWVSQFARCFQGDANYRTGSI